MLDGASHYEFGKQLKRVLHAESSRVAVIASADLSHKLSAASPGGPSTQGPQFDELIKTHVADKTADALKAFDPAIVEQAGQCGYRPIMTLLGTLDEMNVQAKVLSYEAPFGVGYLTARFDIL